MRSRNDSAYMNFFPESFVTCNIDSPTPRNDFDPKKLFRSSITPYVVHSSLRNFLCVVFSSSPFSVNGFDPVSPSHYALKTLHQRRFRSRIQRAVTSQ